ncbi:MAG: IS110 family transposase [Acetobacteraceae bacterium]|nr:IS110 family transposase [Acetobacteraceae bacterium]
MQLTTIGLDIAKHVFQLHGVGSGGQVLLRRQVRRSELLAFFKALPPCVIGMEACPSAHYWARELSALGHTVRLMPAAYVKPYVKRGKSDAIDAEAICEAVTRPTMRFVPAKSPEQQSVVMLHRTRDLLVRQRTMLANALRGHLGEFGVIAAKGMSRLPELVALASSAPVCQLPDVARECVELLLAQLEDLQRRIVMIERSIVSCHRSSEASRRLETIPGVGVITATAVTAFVSDATAFRSARQFAAWIGLAPQLRGTGGKVQLGRISKAGNRYLRRLLTIGATSLVRCARRSPEKFGWISALLARRPTRVVITAVANKLARVIWAVLTRGESFRRLQTAAT